MRELRHELRHVTGTMRCTSTSLSCDPCEAPCPLTPTCHVLHPHVIACPVAARCHGHMRPCKVPSSQLQVSRHSDLAGHVQSCALPAVPCQLWAHRACLSCALSALAACLRATCRAACSCCSFGYRSVLVLRPTCSLAASVSLAPPIVSPCDVHACDWT